MLFRNVCGCRNSIGGERYKFVICITLEFAFFVFERQGLPVSGIVCTYELFDQLKS